MHLIQSPCLLYAKKSGLWFKSVTHILAYTCLVHDEDKEKVLRMTDPGKIWWALNKAPFDRREDWEQARAKFLENALRLKYDQNPILITHLRSIGKAAYSAPDNDAWVLPTVAKVLKYYLKYDEPTGYENLFD